MKSQQIYILAVATVLCILISKGSNAQTKIDTNATASVRSLNKFKLYLLGIGIEREQKITKTVTLSLGAAIESVVPFHPRQPDSYSDVLSIDYSINFSPIVHVALKKYFNLKAREKKGKTTANNSGQYFGLEYNLITPILINHRYSTNYISSFTPVWGFQKSVAKKTNVECVIGPSYQTDFNRSRISAMARFGFNYLF